MFVSSLAFNRFYEGIIDYLALHKYADRQQLHDASSDGRASPGGRFTTILDELVDLDFVERYNNDSTLTRKVMLDTQDKVDLFLERNPKYARYTVETALITTEPAPDGIRNEGYFTYMIDTEQLFKASSAL